MKLILLNEDEFDDIESNEPVDDRDEFSDDRCPACHYIIEICAGCRFPLCACSYVIECHKCQNYCCLSCVLQSISPYCNKQTRELFEKLKPHISFPYQPHTPQRPPWAHYICCSKPPAFITQLKPITPSNVDQLLTQ